MEGQIIETTVVESGERERRIEWCTHVLAHASNCSGCSVFACGRLRGVLEHARQCGAQGEGCSVCRGLAALCCRHAARCTLSPSAACSVPLCFKLKQIWRWQRRLAARRTRRRCGGELGAGPDRMGCEKSASRHLAASG